MFASSGAAVTSVAETSDQEDGKLKFTGIFYLVEKKNNKWEIKHKKEVKDVQDVGDTSNLDKYLPKASDELKDSVGGEWWGFMDNTKTLNKACKKDGCGGNAKVGEPVKKELSWTNSSSGGTSISNWSKDFNWWDNLYKLITWDLSNKLSGFNGSWSVTTNP